MLRVALFVYPAGGSNTSSRAGCDWSAMAQDVYVKTRAHSDAFAIVDRSKPARDDVFEPPAGYTKKATLSMQDLKR